MWRFLPGELDDRVVVVDDVRAGDVLLETSLPRRVRAGTRVAREQPGDLPSERTERLARQRETPRCGLRSGHVVTHDRSRISEIISLMNGASTGIRALTHPRRLVPFVVETTCLHVGHMLLPTGITCFLHLSAGAELLAVSPGSSWRTAVRLSVHPSAYGRPPHPLPVQGVALAAFAIFRKVSR